MTEPQFLEDVDQDLTADIEAVEIFTSGPSAVALGSTPNGDGEEE